MKRKDHERLLWIHVAIMVLLVVLICGVVLLIQKSKKPPVTSQTSYSSPKIISASFGCDDGKTIQVQFYNNQAELALSDGRNMMLLQGISGSGARYTNDDESFTFWNKGNTAFIQEGKDNTLTYENCIQSGK